MSQEGVWHRRLRQRQRSAEDDGRAVHVHDSSQVAEVVMSMAGEEGLREGVGVAVKVQYAVEVEVDVDVEKCGVAWLWRKGSYR